MCEYGRRGKHGVAAKVGIIFTYQGQVPIFNGRDERFSFGHLACVLMGCSAGGLGEMLGGYFFTSVSLQRPSSSSIPRHITTLSPLSPPHTPHTPPHKPARSVREEAQEAPARASGSLLQCCSTQETRAQKMAWS